MRTLLQAALFLSILLAAGCGPKESAAERDDKTLPPAPQEAPPTPANPSSAPVIPLKPIGLVNQALHEEPAKDGWPGEVFNELATKQLKSLGKLLIHPEKLAEEPLRNYVDDEFQPAPLVPAELEVVFEDPALRVMRASHSEDSASPPSLLGAARDLVAPFLDGTDLRTEFKIFRVALEEDGNPVSESWFQLSGHTPEGTLSRRARWRCQWSWPQQDEPPLLRSIEVSEFEQTEGRGGPLFADSTKSVFSKPETFEAQFNRGIEHWAARLEARYGIGISGWHGLAIGDANGDGLDDLYVCEPGGLPNRLFVAKSDGTVLDVSSLSGTDLRLQTQAALFLDLDNDGDQDLVLATTIGVVFLENDGRGSFAVKATELVPEAPPVALAAADYDLDGDLDVYVGCYSLRRASAGAQILGRPIPYHDANNGGRNVLLRNDRKWRFRNVTLDVGMDQNNRRFTLAASWEDYDDDGDPDLYVANDYGRNNLYRNDRDASGDSTFTDVAAEAGVEDLSAGMSVSWGDADGDGDRDLYVSNMWSSAGNRVAYQRNFQPGADETTRGEFQRHARGNSLFLNNGDGTFRDASQESGVTMGRWAWGSIFADLNNDGWEDLFVTNGFLTQPDDSGDL